MAGQHVVMNWLESLATAVEGPPDLAGVPQLGRRAELVGEGHLRVDPVRLA